MQNQDQLILNVQHLENVLGKTWSYVISTSKYAQGK